VTLLGNFALLLGLIAAGYAVVVGVVGVRSGREEPVRSAEGAMKAAAVSLSVAALALTVLLLRKDFRVEYVAQYTSRDLSVFYTIGAFWAGQAGSLLLWAWTLSLIGVGVIFQNRARNRDLMPWVTVTLGVVLAFFAVLVTFYANPFRTLPVAPADGQGLNPLLQNYGQWVHPIALYLGFVGFTVPFAFAVGALATGKLGDRWIRSVRKWALWAWVLLTAGILFGARWAYVELGWGGYWAWDPVENASLLPWLVGTAYLHSVVVQEKRGMLRVWNVSLAVAAFAMSIFGTFLTRSGIISSVHAFAESSMGPLLIGFTFLTVAVGTALIVWRLPALRASGRITSVVSREASFLLTNLLFVGMTIVVLWGTIYPIVSEAVRGVEISVGQPFFNALMAPLAIVTIALVGTCPLLPWRHASGRHLKRNFRCRSRSAAPCSCAGDREPRETAGRHGARDRRVRPRHRHGRGLARAERSAPPPRRVLAARGAEPVRVHPSPVRRPHRPRRRRDHARRHLLQPRDEAGGRVAARGRRVGADRREHRDVRGPDLRADHLEVRAHRHVPSHGAGRRGSRNDPHRAGRVRGPTAGDRGRHALDPRRRPVRRDEQRRSDRAVATVLVFHEPAVFWIWTGMIVIVAGGILAAWPWRTDRAARGGLDDLEVPSAFEEPGVAR
jgi:cytochrome c biogenesis factor